MSARTGIIIALVLLVLVAIFAAILTVSSNAANRRGTASLTDAYGYGFVPAAQQPQYITVPAPVIVTTSEISQPAPQRTVTNTTNTNTVVRERVVETRPGWANPYYYYGETPTTYVPPREFSPQIAPATSRRYVYTSEVACSSVKFTCSYNEQAFNDASGCGCERVAPSRRYLHRDLSVCRNVQFVCESGERTFSDSTGCGCESDPYSNYGYRNY